MSPSDEKPEQSYEIQHVLCHDRGDSLRRNALNARRQNGVLSHTNPSTLYEALWDARVPYLKNKNKYFIPFDKLELARNRKLVEQSLRDGYIPENDIPTLADKICSENPDSHGTFFRIFATLVLCQSVGCINDFAEQGVDDSWLPLPRIERDRQDIKIIPLKNRQHSHPERLTVLFQNPREWNQPMLDAFDKYQWWTVAPFFDRQGKDVHHYVLEENDVLPFTDRKTQIPEYDVDSLDQDVQDVIIEGGFGDVFIVNLHPSHYRFDNQPYMNGSHSFALKCLKSSSKHDFQLEVDALRKYDYGIDDHIIPLLATFQKEEDNTERYYLLFPKANGNLRDFWKMQFNIGSDGSLLRWMAEECLGIAKVLSMLHKDQEDQGKDDNYPIYGRHGDVKAANILWFCNPSIKGPAGWRLVLSDFGLARFHRAISISAQTASKLRKTLTYQAPEFDIIKGRVSRKSDIWAFGCMLLEFITCYIQGYEAVEKDFPSQRAEKDARLGYSEDRFYRTINDRKWAELKPKVRKWILKLRKDSRCTPYLRDLLSYIEKSMFSIGLDDRPTAAQVVLKLGSLEVA